MTLCDTRSFFLAPGASKLSDLMELTRLLGTRFIARKDVKSLQSPTGEWYPPKCAACKRDGITCLHNPMTLADFENHFSGKQTMGHYLVNPEDGTCKLFAFDLDVRKPDSKTGYDPTDSLGVPYNPREVFLDRAHTERQGLVSQLRALADGLAIRVNSLLGIPVAIAYSGGKGLHVYCFTGVIPAEAAQAMAHGILDGWCFTAVRGKNFWRHDDPSEYGDVEIETFPKQANVSEGGMGNLMKLPLGVHKGSGERSFFITSNAPLHDLVEKSAVRTLEGDLPWE